MRKKKKSLKYITVTVLIFSILLGSFLIVDRRMRNVLCDYSASVGETVMIRTVDEIVSDIFYEDDIDYSDLVTLCRDNERE